MYHCFDLTFSEDEHTLHKFSQNAYMLLLYAAGTVQCRL